VPNDDDLALNSLSRYAKSSPRLILEEHGHCEVPAGCGGVVLRWRNPDRGVPITMWAYALGELRLYLDGEPVEWSRPIVSPGAHVLGFVVSGVEPASIALMFAAHDETGAVQSPPGAYRVLSAPDGSWRYTTSEPAGDWLAPSFDDGPWLPMSERDQLSSDGTSDHSEYRLSRIRKLGAVGLGADTTGAVWVRKTFELPHSAGSPLAHGEGA
jgi:hypothetical protein